MAVIERPIVTLLTDFGTGDGYVAQMKAVILSGCPVCQVVDISHLVPPQHIRVAARILRQTAMFFSPGTVHVAVVDPGVGTPRRILAAEIAGQRFVLPDNGMLSCLLDDFQLTECVQVENRAFWRPEVSHTFHGRDIMAPVAARLAGGMALSDLGPPAEELCRLEAVRARLGETLVTEVAQVDRFGNVLLEDSAAIGRWLASRGLDTSEGAWLRLRVGGDWHKLRLATTYGLGSAADFLLLVGSQGAYELAITGGDAADALQAEVGSEVEFVVPAEAD